MKVLLAEDTQDMNRVLTVALEHEGYEVDACFDGEEALEHALDENYDAMVLDIMMPKMNGLDVVRELRRRNIVTPVLMLTAKAEIDDRVEGLDAGADDYLTKPFSMKELLARVRAMTRRKKDYGRDQLSFGDISLDGEEFELKAENAIRLSVKEFELLETLIINANCKVELDYILEHVWDNSEEADENTVALYVEYLNSKLEAVSSRVRIIQTEKEYQLTAEA